MIMGDFNFYRSLSDRNKSGGNINDIMIFNEIISNLGLLEIPLKGRKYTWSLLLYFPLKKHCQDLALLASEIFSKSF